MRANNSLKAKTKFQNLLTLGTNIRSIRTKKHAIFSVKMDIEPLVV
jgi:hypothetical protein